MIALIYGPGRKSGFIVETNWFDGTDGKVLSNVFVVVVIWKASPPVDIVPKLAAPSAPYVAHSAVNAFSPPIPKLAPAAPKASPSAPYVAPSAVPIT